MMTAHDSVDVVTGAFSYSGSVIARELQAAGRRVRTLTGHPDRAPKGTAIEVRPLDFDDPIGLADSLRGAETLYNTYWVRFARGQLDHATAVANSRALFYAARQAGVERIVHVSITHPAIDSAYSYFRGKAEVERALAEVGVSYAVIRPAILFGGDGVLLNNIAWLLRRIPVFAVGGAGKYRIRPVHLDDLARLCLEAGTSTATTITNAVGPRPTFTELVHAIKDAAGSNSAIVHVPGAVIPALSTALGVALRDSLLTRDEYRAMADGLADVDDPPTGRISLMAWIAQNGHSLGRRYANELDRHFRRPGPRPRWPRGVSANNNKEWP